MPFGVAVCELSRHGARGPCPSGFSPSGTAKRSCSRPHAHASTNRSLLLRANGVPGVTNVPFKEAAVRLFDFDAQCHQTFFRAVTGGRPWRRGADPHAWPSPRTNASPIPHQPSTRFGATQLRHAYCLPEELDARVECGGRRCLVTPRLRLPIGGGDG